MIQPGMNGNGDQQKLSALASVARVAQKAGEMKNREPAN